MLALTRRIGESIVIGPPGRPIGTVTIGAISRNGKVKLCFDGFKAIEINRQEVARAKTRGQREGGRGSV